MISKTQLTEQSTNIDQKSSWGARTNNFQMHVVIKSFPVESGPTYHWLVVSTPMKKISKLG
jgi:hypothetical protein